MNIRKFIFIFFFITTTPIEIMAKMLVVDSAIATPYPSPSSAQFNVNWRVIDVSVPGTFATNLYYFGIGENACEIGNPCPPANPLPNYGGTSAQYVALPSTCHDWNCAVDTWVSRKGMSGGYGGTRYLYGRQIYTCVFASSNTATGAGTRLEMLPGSCKVLGGAPTVSCDIPSFATLDHGIMDSSQVDGHSSTTNMTVNCNGVAAVQFRLINDVITVLPGVTSTLTIDSYTPNSVVGVNISKNFTLRSVLTGSSTTSGPLNGASVVVMDIQ